jgi:creatinine amidohydrolase/Fe(II)-dependent formamide hydrolase-like protein
MVSGAPVSRSVGDLTFPEISLWLKETSILCLPIGAIEQHGAHLPLNTDAVIAEELSRRIVAQWGNEFDLWLLPSVSISLSREHDWAPGTLSLTIQSFVALLKDLAREIVRALPARNIVIVNGHGGNRGILDNLMHELHSELCLNVCVIHPFDLSKATTHIASPDIHGGKNETSVMLALAPHLVRRDLARRDSVRQDSVRQDLVRQDLVQPDLPASPRQAADKDAIAAMIFDRGVSFPWRTDDRRIAANGVIGEAHAASPEIGRAIIDSVIVQTRSVLERLLENQRLALGRTRP